MAKYQFEVPRWVSASMLLVMIAFAGIFMSTVYASGNWAFFLYGILFFLFMFGVQIYTLVTGKQPGRLVKIE